MLVVLVVFGVHRAIYKRLACIILLYTDRHQPLSRDDTKNCEIEGDSDTEEGSR